jgi:hypothetical protein
MLEKMTRDEISDLAEKAGNAASAAASAAAYKVLQDAGIERLTLQEVWDTNDVYNSWGEVEDGIRYGLETVQSRRASQ